MACQLDGTPSACRACLELLETMGIQTTIADVYKGRNQQDTGDPLFF